MGLIDGDALKGKLKKHHDFFVNAWGGFKNLPPDCKARVDEISSCIAEIVNAPTIEPYGTWIPCSERLPEEKIHPITKDYLEYTVTFSVGDRNDIRHYKFGKGHWWHFDNIIDKYVTAWMERPEPYKGGDQNE